MTPALPDGAPEPPQGPTEGGRALLWVLLALPLLGLVILWAGAALRYGDVVRWSGFGAALLLVPATLVTPLGALFPRARLVAWLHRRRHAFGGLCILYACAHVAAHVIGTGSPWVILREAREPSLLAGWGALGVLLAFAGVRIRGGGGHPPSAWTRRHRIVHAVAALAILHWAASAFTPLTVQVQTALRAHGYYAGPIDGVIGPLSQQALLRLQQDHRLEVTGTISPAVLDVLGIIPN